MEEKKALHADIKKLNKQLEVEKKNKDGAVKKCADL